MHRMESAVRKSKKQNAKSHKDLVKVEKPPSTVSAIQKHKPGMYKGRVVRAKVDCFRKPRPDMKTTGKKPAVTRSKPEWPKVRSKSVSSLPTSTKPRVNAAVSSRSRSVSEIPLNTTEKPVQVGLKRITRSVTQTGARALPRSAPLATGRSTVSKPLALKKKEKAVQTPETASTEPTLSRPLTSTVSQYTLQMKSAKETRAKFAKWKGMMLKRPPILEKSATFPGLSEPALRPKTGPKPTAALNNDNQTNDIEVPGNKTVCFGKSSNILNTTDLLDTSDMDFPVDSETRMESSVLSLCDKFEAMATLSSCEDDTKKADNEDYQDPKEKQPLASKDEMMKSTTPNMAGASFVKYNVKTTPYLQKLKKKIECETTPGRGSRRTNLIKDLKFLTPVRRSTRLQLKSSSLPGLLNKHNDICISSLAELMQSEDANAYIYRKNPALLEELPEDL